MRLRTDSKDTFPGGVAFHCDTGEDDCEPKEETADEAPTQAERDKMAESQFADPENKKYPVDTPEHTRAAASYAAKEHNAGRLSDAKFTEIQARINKARKKHGVGEENQDSLLAIKGAYPDSVSTQQTPNTPATSETPVKETPDVLLGRIDSLTASNAELQKRLDAVPQQIEAAATARASLLAQVAPHMGKEWKADGKSEGQIVKEALVALRPEMKLDGRSDDYIRGAYEQALTTVETSRKSVGSMQAPLHPALLRKDGDPDMDALEAQNKAAKKKSQDAWKVPAKGATTRDSLRK